MFKELWKVEEEIYIIPYNRPFFLFFFPHQFCFSSNVFVCLHESLIWRNSKPSSSSIGKTTLSDSPEEDMIFTLRVISRINKKKKCFFFGCCLNSRRERERKVLYYFFSFSLSTMWRTLTRGHSALRWCCPRAATASGLHPWYPVLKPVRRMKERI